MFSHGFWQQHRIQRWTLAAYSRITDPNQNRPWPQEDQGARHGPERLCRPRTSTWLQVLLRHQHGYSLWNQPQIFEWPWFTKLSTDINTIPGCIRTIDPLMSLSGNKTMGLNMASDGYASHSNQHVPCAPRLESPRTSKGCHQ